METELLVSCTNLILDSLINKYEAGKICRKVFISNILLKKKFLRENIDSITSQEERNTAQRLLKKCDIIMSTNQ